MRFPFFGLRRKPGPISLALPEMVQITFLVYLSADGPPPKAEDLPALVAGWIRQHAAEPFDEMLCDWVERGLVTLQVWETSQVPAPPLDLMSHFGATEDETDRFERSTHCITIISPDMLLPPRCGLWGGLAAARALANAFDGVVVDTAFPRFLPVKSYQDDLAAKGRIAIARHICVPFSVDHRGKGWMTTTGMQKFGLPNLEVHDVPPDLSSGLLPVVNAIAQNLTDRVLRLAVEEGAPPRKLSVEPELRVTVDQIARAFGEEASEPEEGVRGWTSIGLSFNRPSRGQERMLQVIPPHGFPGDQGVWLHSMLSDLSHGAYEVRGIAKDSAAMEQAHARALAELPAIKKRFQQGLEPGQLLHVKHGFPTRSGGHEYMWVAVNTWVGDRVRGQLANDPIDRVDLRAGQAVELSDAEIFDWLFTDSDGEHEGGYTNSPLNDEGVDLNEQADE